MIRWFAGHPTAANLLLILMIAAGAVAAPGLIRETFPDFRPTEAEVSVTYRGAGASDVEDAVCRVLWDAVQRVENLAEFTCTAQDNRASGIATMAASGDTGRFMEDLRGEVAAITDLPDRSDPPVVRALHRTDFVTAVGITGDMPLPHLELYAANLQDRLRALPGVADVTLSGFGARQYRIEVSAEVLRQHGLTIEGLARQIGAQSVDLPGGTLETGARELRLRFTDEPELERPLMHYPAVAMPHRRQAVLRPARGQRSLSRDILRSSARPKKGGYGGQEVVPCPSIFFPSSALTECLGIRAASSARSARLCRGMSGPSASASKW